MNQLGNSLTEGAHTLNGTITVTIERKNGKTYLGMGGIHLIEITTSVQDGLRWKIWYHLNGTEKSAIVERVLED